jgi:hypothetical protein
MGRITTGQITTIQMMMDLTMAAADMVGRVAADIRPVARVRMAGIDRQKLRAYA